MPTLWLVALCTSTLGDAPFLPRGKGALILILGGMLMLASSLLMAASPVLFHRTPRPISAVPRPVPASLIPPHIDILPAAGAGRATRPVPLQVIRPVTRSSRAERPAAPSPAALGRAMRALAERGIARPVLTGRPGGHRGTGRLVAVQPCGTCRADTTRSRPCEAERRAIARVAAEFLPGCTVREVPHERAGRDRCLFEVRGGGAA